MMRSKIELSACQWLLEEVAVSGVDLAASGVGGFINCPKLSAI